MTRSTVKRLTKLLDKREREFWRRRKAALRSHENENLAIAGRNLFNDEASSSYNTGAKPPTPPKTLHDHSHPNSSVGLKNPYLIYDYCGGSHEADECKQTNPAKQVYLSRGDLYNDPFLLSKFKDELANFMLEKKSNTKGIGDMLDQHRKELHEQFSQILSMIKKSETPEPKAPTFAITTKLGVSTQDPPFRDPQRPTLKKQKKDDEDDRLLSIFKKIHINLPFLEAMIHMPKGSKVLKDLLLHKEKLEKAAYLVKLSEE
ncbi:hypothetical protein Tco_0307521 [Tanacetum coccineum]